jgi:hypothetical protein
MRSQPPSSSYLAYTPPIPKPRRRWTEVILEFAHANSAFLVSTMLHVCVLAFLATIVITTSPHQLAMQFNFEPDAGAASDMQLSSDAIAESFEFTAEPEESSSEEFTSKLTGAIPSSSLELSTPTDRDVDGPMRSSSETNSAPSENAENDDKPNAIPLHTGMVSGRSGQRRALLLKKYGGTETTEAAVRLGIEWLVRQQTPSGSWSFTGPYTGGARFDDNPEAATAMALLAVLGAGHTHKAGDYKKNVDDALKWLVRRQLRNGQFGADTPRHHSMYTHAQAMLALCEAYAMTDDSWLRPYCERAVDFAVKSQGSKGGWRYEPRGDSDTSVTGWFLVALISARAGGFEVPDTTLRRVSGWLNKVDEDYGAAYRYMEGQRATSSMTAEGLLCRMYLGWDQSRSALDKGTKTLLRVAPFQGDAPHFYYWYYATQVMHHMGGRTWDKWNTAMREQLPAMQEKLPPEAGSWPAKGDRFDTMAGRLYCTCMALYCLEVYYRHLPIYETPWK